VTADRRQEAADTDARARALVQTGEHAAAATVLVTAYGPEVLGWLRAMCRTQAEGDDAFATVCERLWLALPRLRTEGSLRTWMYVVARNVMHDQRRRAGVRAAVPISAVPDLEALVRSTTAAYRDTSNKDRLRTLRDALEPEDRTLLVLRVDREMSWRDIAEILAGGAEDPDAIARDAARLRKRFERVKERLRASWDGAGGS
jgi:RNA polymerase sigma-70 factor (ECF subfamily)